MLGDRVIESASSGGAEGRDAYEADGERAREVDEEAKGSLEAGILLVWDGRRE